MAWLRRGASFRCNSNFFSYNLTHRTANYVRSSTAAHPEWSSRKIRKTFMDFFVQNDHKYVPSSSVIPKKGGGTYFINAGMNQFKPVFLGTVDPSSDLATYKRVTNSQKCIRVGGKHNDLEDVGKDTYHHTFFEMLGSWSFGTYFKEEACQLAWKLLTEVYMLDPEKLYVTYFAGDKSLGLEIDEECKHIWLQMGLSPDKVVPYSSTDNFWDMGETGPCGPCTEIHYNNTSQKDVSHLVNAGDPRVVELWNLVFMQYDRQDNQTLIPLKSKHVDTGMGLERLVAVMQGKLSNYDTDLFLPYFDHIQKRSGCSHYGNNDNLDIAYRIIADHTRMATVSIADGLLPGRKDLDSKLRTVIHRAVNQSRRMMKSEPGLLGSLVPLVVESLGEFFPELAQNPKEISGVIDLCEQKYLHNLEIGSEMLKKALTKYGDINTLTSEQVWEIQEGRFGRPVPLDIIKELFGELDRAFDIATYEKYLKDKKEVAQPMLDSSTQIEMKQQLLSQLQSDGVPATDDSFKYKYSSFMGRYFLEAPLGEIKALLHQGRFVDAVPQGELCGVFLSKTAFYANAGGQVGDRGWLSSLEGCDAVVSDVSKTQGYVLHVATVEEGTLRVHDGVQMAVDQVHREKCMKNHTATHVLNYALNKVLGKVQQAGSMVNAEKLTFDFTSLKAGVSQEDLKEISDLVQKLVQKKIPVSRKLVALKDAKQIKGLSFLNDEAYPNKVIIVSIGADIDEMVAYPNSELGLEHSVELCGGTHVDNTADIGSIAITNFHGAKQGTKRITAVTGDAAIQADTMAKVIEEQVEELKTWIKAGYNEQQWITRVEGIDKALSGEQVVLPKVLRDRIKQSVETISRSHINSLRIKMKKKSLEYEVTNLLENESAAGFTVNESQFSKLREVAEVLSRVRPSCPVMLFSHSTEKPRHIMGICFVPEGLPQGLSAESWSRHIAKATNGTSGPMKGKKNKDKSINVVTFTKTDLHTMEGAIDLARSFAAFLLDETVQKKQNS